MQQSLINEKLLQYHNNQMSDVLKYLLNSNSKIINQSTKLPPLSILGSIKHSPKNKRSRIYSLNQDSTYQGTSRIDLTQQIENGEYTYKELTLKSTAKCPKLRMPEQTERSIDGSPSFQSNQTLKFKYPSMLDSLRGTKLNILNQYLEDNSQLFREIIYKKDLEKMISFLNYPIQYSQELNLLKLFSDLLFFVAYFANTIISLNKASYLFHDCLKLSELNRDHILKIKILIQFYDIAKQLKQFEQARKFIQKALNYAWADNLEDYEIDCYDKLGMCYFYMGNISKANHFHTKWAKCEVEPKNSYYRQTSKDFIKLYEKQIPICKEFDDIIQRYLHIPFINIKTGKMFDEQSTIKYNNCLAQTILDQIQQGVDFLQFQIEYHYIDIKAKQHFNKAALPRRAIEIMSKYDLNKDKYIFDHKIDENPIYKLSLEERVNFRKNKSYSLDQVQKNIRKFIAEQREPFQKSNKVYVKDSQRKDLIPQNANQLSINFKKMFQSVISLE
ncbi:unnamed protein product [Paramecium sonneborni]|uniref:Tetratricopeptide repeat protein n=1 Tax=Paramecium sonneborni TaxID=65129 RepID=A0A8S1RA42_9CILI|nr:unnamed protein product [Paramecium sonneborni]